MLHACRIAVPPPQPLLIFDGDCGFCRRWIARWQQLTGDKVRYASSQEEARLFPEINPEEFQRSVILIDVDGRVYSGSEAVFRSLAVSSKWAVLLRLYQKFPGFAALTEWIYRQVASHRQLASALTRWI